MQFAKTAYVGDITALESLSALGPPWTGVLAGVGPDLLWFHLPSGALLLRTQLFPSARVHGISAHRDHGARATGGVPLSASAVAHGGRHVAVLRLQLAASRGDGGGAAADVACRLPAFRHWVLCASLLDATAAGKTAGSAPPTLLLVVGLSDNSVELWGNVGGAAPSQLRRCRSTERCLLYSLAVSGETPETLRVASGTIFNRVLLWRPFQSAGGSPSGECAPDCALDGHEGSIHRVRWSRCGRLLCSASDDRTARVWRVREGSGGLAQDGPPTVMFGHGGRVWDGEFVSLRTAAFSTSSPDAAPDALATVSDDLTLRVWSLLGTSERGAAEAGGAPQQAQQLAVLKGHRGRAVWKVCCVGGAAVVTGGADSGVKLWNLSAVAPVAPDADRAAGQRPAGEAAPATQQPPPGAIVESLRFSLPALARAGAAAPGTGALQQEGGACGGCAEPPPYSPGAASDAQGAEGEREERQAAAAPGGPGAGGEARDSTAEYVRALAIVSADLVLAVTNRGLIHALALSPVPAPHTSSSERAAQQCTDGAAPSGSWSLLFENPAPSPWMAIAASPPRAEAGGGGGGAESGPAGPLAAGWSALALAGDMAGWAVLLRLDVGPPDPQGEKGLLIPPVCRASLLARWHAHPGQQNMTSLLLPAAPFLADACLAPGPAGDRGVLPATADARGTLRVWHVASGGGEALLMAEVAAPQQRVRLLCAAACGESHLLLAGNKAGAVFVFALPPPLSALPSPSPAAPLVSPPCVGDLRRCHGTTWVSFLRPLGSGRFLSGGRDGSVCHYETTPAAPTALAGAGPEPPQLGAAAALSVRLARRQRTPLSSVDALGRAQGAAAGFRGGDLIVCHLGEGGELARHPCGGPHRPYDVRLLGGGDALGAGGGPGGPEHAFCFWRDGAVHVRRAWAARAGAAGAGEAGEAGAASRAAGAGPLGRNLLLSHHGREIHSVVLVPAPPGATPALAAGVVTASEDGALFRLALASRGPGGAHAGRSRSLLLRDSAPLAESPGGTSIRSMSLVPDPTAPGAWILLAAGAKETLSAWLLRWEAPAAQQPQQPQPQPEPPAPPAEPHLSASLLGVRARPPDASHLIWRAASGAFSKGSDLGDGDQRHMAVAGMCAGGVLFVAVSSSDATLALCAVPVSQGDAEATGDTSFSGGRRWRTVALLRHHAGPVLSLAHVGVCAAAAGGGGRPTHLLFSGSTDGEVAVWDLTDTVATHLARFAALAGGAPGPGGSSPPKQQGYARKPPAPKEPPLDLRPVLVLRSAHQSGVNALAAAALAPVPTTSGATPPLVVLLSGGDDEALSACLFSVESAGPAADGGDIRPAKVRCEAATRRPGAHSSAVKGAAMSADGRVAFTTGLDQRVCRWHLSVSSAPPDVLGDDSTRQPFEDPWISRWRASAPPTAGEATAGDAFDLRELWAAAPPPHGRGPPPGGCGLALRLEKAAEAVTEVPDVEAVAALCVQRPAAKLPPDGVTGTSVVRNGSEEEGGSSRGGKQHKATMPGAAADDEEGTWMVAVAGRALQTLECSSRRSG